MRKLKPEPHTCWHEAGHAVIGLMQGLAVNQVTVMTEGDANGCCVSPSLLMYDVDTARERRILARRCIIAMYAGIEAERLFNPDAPEFHADEDVQNAFDLSRDYGVLPRGGGYVGDDAHEALLNRLRGEARRFVHRHQHQIKLLADALLKTHTLCGADVAQIIGLD